MVSSRRDKDVSMGLTNAIADTIQQMYLKELQSYKSPPVKAGDSEGLVQKFTPPAPPKAPEDTDLANDMKAYEDQVVEIEGQAAAGEQSETEGDYFEDLKQFDEEPAPH
jgi:F-type H+-transporting ATPase subunit h